MAYITKRELTVHHFEGDAGDHIKTTAKEVIAYLEEKNRERPSEIRITATLKFNGNILSITQSSTVESVMAEFSARMDADSEKYRKSPEGIASAAATVARRQAAQERMDAVVWVLTAHLNEDFAAQKAEGHTQPQGELACQVFEALRIATDASDMVGVSWDKPAFIKILQDFGYVGNEFVGQGNVINTLESHRAYVAGQIINCINRMGLIPPVAGVKIKQHGLNTDTYIP